MYSKQEEEEKAIREAIALRKSGRCSNYNNKRTRQAENYNKKEFEKLFKEITQ